MVKNFIVKRKVFINKKTGQPSITIPKKELKKFFDKMPKELIVTISKKKKW